MMPLCVSNGSLSNDQHYFIFGLQISPHALVFTNWYEKVHVCEVDY